MVEKPAVDGFLIDVVMNRGVIEHHHRHLAGRAFLRDLIKKPDDIGTLDGCLAGFML